MNKFSTHEEILGLLLVLASWLAAKLSPLVPFLGLVMALVVADFITGVMAAKERGETITSRGFRRSVEKITLYFIAILAAEGMEKVFGIPYVTYLVTLLIARTEFKSNIENVEQVTGTPIWKDIKHIFERILNLKK